MDDEEAARDDIFAAPREKFVATRDEWAKRLRDEGHKEAAARIKALKRPTAAAWVLNQVARTHRADLEALLAAGQALGAAQQRGDGDVLRRASEEVRARARALIQRARKVLGKPPAPALSRALWQALYRAAAGEAIDELRAGRLEREPSGAAGFDLVEGPIAVTKPSKPAPKKEHEDTRAKAREAEQQRKRERERQRERERRAHDLERAKRRAERLRREADDAVRAADDAERALAALERKLEST